MISFYIEIPCSIPQYGDLKWGAWVPVEKKPHTGSVTPPGIPEIPVKPPDADTKINKPKISPD